MKTILIAILAVSLITLGLSHNANAQVQAGGVNKQGTWYVGEDLKKGDLYSYNLCHVYYKDCTQFKIDFWVEGSEKVGSEDQWKLQTVVYDAGKIHKGTINLGKIAAEPIGSSKNMIPYAAAFKSSLSWLSAYATADPTQFSIKGPKSFTAPSWGKIGNIGGEQIIPGSEEKVAVPDGVFDTVRITWKTGGKVNNVWIVDDFPFPVKADTYAHVSSGVPPQEYRFELLDYQENVDKNPFTKIIDSGEEAVNKDCPPTSDDFTMISKNTNTGSMIVNVKYAPKNPKQGCTMDMIIDFKRKENQEEFVNQVHYDIMVVDTSSSGIPKTLRSLASESDRDSFFVTSGQIRTTIDVKESGKTTYAILVTGTGPETAPDPERAGYITFDVNVQPGTSTPPPPPDTPKCTSDQVLKDGKCVPKDKPTPPRTDDYAVPSWIKSSAKFWSDSKITDKDFVTGIQYLINKKIVKVPAGTASDTKSDTIPSWVKSTAGYWADGKTSDKEFVGALQFLITNGIIKLKS
ncbi:MAG: peptidase [Nitrososphaeria archaeon]|nr:peptidase [Nitrososphaeria archaeon]NDB88416.1 peptidase [Nitrososphaerota archaeon]NDB91535.1 peptidase [Nitrososphaeria archaeon]NDF27064.1 peptidase [Nitrosopumilaceae archaeon]NDF46682.1 peptidase [Nitrosopumilaceae archaeon]